MRIALVTDAPRPESKVTIEYTQRVFNAVSHMAGLPVELVWVPAVTELPAGGKAPAIAVLRAGRADLLRRLRDVNPDTVMSLGGAALNALTEGEATIIKKQHGRMRWLDLDGPPQGFLVPWTPGIAPFQAVRNSDLHRDFANVAYKVVTQRRPVLAMDIETRVPTTPEELRSDLIVLEGASVIGVDVETTGLSPYGDDLLAVGLGAIYTDQDYGYAVVVTPELLSDPHVPEILWDATWRKTRISVGHNFKFDMQFLAPVVGWAPDKASLGDSLILAHLLDERPTRPNSRARGSGLKDLVAQRYDHEYGFDFKEEVTPERLPELYGYLGKDVAYTARLWGDLVREADAEPNVMRAHDSLLIPAVRAMAKCEYTGAAVDLEWVRETVAILAARIARRQLALEKSLRRLTVTVEVANILAPQQVADAMYDDWSMTPDVRKHGRLVEDDRSTDADHMDAAIAKYRKHADERMRRRARWLAGLQRLRKDVRLKTTYEKSILARADGDERVRASFLLHGASTGRLSSQGPNLQNVPAVDDREVRNGKPWYKLRDGKWTSRPMRRAFAPKAGRVWVEVDYSQLELRVAAALSGDPDFTAVFTSGRDVHREVSSAIFSKAPADITKPERYLAKAVAFGILYGRTADALAGGAEMDYAVRELGMQRWSSEVAQAFIHKFLRTYPRLQAWMDSTQASAVALGYVESPYGRRRRFPLTPRSQSERNSIARQAVNTPVQATASDICLEALAKLVGLFEGTTVQVLFPVHDSVCIECDEADVASVEATCRFVMERDFMGVPLTVDFEWGPSWADVTAHA